MLQLALTAQAVSYFFGTKASTSRLLQIGRAEPACECGCHRLRDRPLANGLGQTYLR